MRQPLIRAALVTAALAFVTVSLTLAVGTAAGTIISNQATVNYTDSNGNPLSVASNVVTTTVSQVGSVTVAPDGAANSNPGDTVFYAHQVTNGGNGSDTIDMTAVSGNGWVTVIFNDNNGDGAFDAGDTPMVDTDGDGTPDTGALAADAVVNILAAVTVPPGTVDGTTDSMTVTGTSSFDNTVSDFATDTTSVNAPDVTVVKSVVPAGPQIPGTTLTYSVVVTNNGTGDAAAVVLTDNVPANTTFVAGSITLNAASKTDAGGDDEADYNVTTGGAVTVDVGILIPTATATITFQVTIN
jgi:uncharacterized repeat protein (TIGR01451 family)